ncbi:hypothetical protein [Gluconobacter wancherniae]|nr:hypothetical protein [Gluconobacter wancherniae]
MSVNPKDQPKEREATMVAPVRLTGHSPNVLSIDTKPGLPIPFEA